MFMFDIDIMFSALAFRRHRRSLLLYRRLALGPCTVYAHAQQLAQNKLAKLRHVRGWTGYCRPT